MPCLVIVVNMNSTLAPKSFELGIGWLLIVCHALGQAHRRRWSCVKDPKRFPIRPFRILYVLAFRLEFFLYPKTISWTSIVEHIDK
jgi:hypothetical protein